MKLLKFSMLMNYFAVSKNSKRALLIINIGIFLSIFAATAACISLYIENKVTKLEFEHLQSSKSKRYLESRSKEIPQVINFYIQFENMEKTYKSFSETMRLNGFGKTIISPNDLHLPSLFYFSNEYKDIKDLIEMIDEALEWMPIHPDEIPKIKEKIKIIKDYILKIDPAIKKYNYETIIFNNTYNDLLDDLLFTTQAAIDDLKSNKRSNLDDFGEFSNQYTLRKKIDNLSRELFEFTLYGINNVILSFDSDLEEINEEIKHYSNLEKNIILLAFIFQLIIFIIIQFFEISSINLNLKRNKNLKFLTKK